MDFNYDLIVIGAGAGGLTSAISAKGFGKSVLLIEKDKPGGECTWSGCVPSKGLINIAKEVHTAKKYVDFIPDTKKALSDVRGIIARIYAHETPEVLQDMGINYINGKAEFLDKNTLIVGENTFTGKSIIISTGSSPFVPPIEGLDKIEYLTNENLFTQEKLPKSMIILGAGAIGVEMGQALNRLGVEVHLVEMAKNILIREDQELASILRESLINEGLHIHLETKAIKVEEVEGIINLTTEIYGNTNIISADSLLVSVGRKANVDGLNLEKAEIDYSSKGIVVDKHLQTTNSKVYAVGDVVGPYQFSHMANYQGIIAVQNALTPLKKSVDYKHVTWCTFTEPELASAGMNEVEAAKEHGEIKVYRYSSEDLDRAKTKKDDIFEIKIICDSKKKILGCQILADRAGELISEIQAMKVNDLSLDKLAGVVHPYPSYAEIFNKAGKKAYIDKLTSNPLVHFIQSRRK